MRLSTGSPMNKSFWRNRTSGIGSLAYFLFVTVGPPLCYAQPVTIRVISTENGRPLQKQPVKLFLLYGPGEKIPANQKGMLRLETNVNGEAQFRLPEPPPAHLTVLVDIDGNRWHCPCGVLAITEDVMSKGIVKSAAEPGKSHAFEKQVPGKILFVARPLSFFERLLAPLLSR